MQFEVFQTRNNKGVIKKDRYFQILCFELICDCVAYFVIVSLLNVLKLGTNADVRVYLFITNEAKCVSDVRCLFPGCFCFVVGKGWSRFEADEIDLRRGDRC